MRFEDSSIVALGYHFWLFLANTQLLDDNREFEIETYFEVFPGQLWLDDSLRTSEGHYLLLLVSNVPCNQTFNG